MATVIDALVITLGLDPKGVKKGSAEAEGAMGKARAAAGKMGDGIDRGAQQGADAIRKLSREALSFFAVLTAGKTLKAFVADTTASNIALGNMARNIGTSAQSLGAWQNVARAFGGTASDVSGSMQSLVSQFQTIEGRQNLGRAFGQMGVGLAGANGQIRDMNELLPDLARAAQRLGPQQFSALGAQAGFSQGFINMLEQGPDKIQALYRALKTYAPTDADIKASGQLEMDWIRLTAQSEAFGRSIMTSLTPEVHELMQWVSQLIDKNQGWLRQDIDVYAKKIGDAIQSADWKTVGSEILAIKDYLSAIDWKGIESGIKEFASGANDAAQAVGGWSEATKILFDLWAASKILRIISLVTKFAGGMQIVAGYFALKAYEKTGIGERFETFTDNYVPGFGAADNIFSKIGLGRSYGQQNALRVMKGMDPGTMLKMGKILSASGWSSDQVSGLLANAATESSLNPFAVNGVAYGLFQWHQDRQAAYQQRYGHSMQSVKDPDIATKEQLDFASWELQNTEKSAGDALRAAKDPGVAGAIVSRYYERPLNADREVENRSALAQYIAGQNLALSGAQAAPAQSTTNTSTSTATANITINAPGGDPNAIAHAVGQQLDARQFKARQTNLATQ